MKQLVRLTICLLLILAAAQLSTAQKPELVVQTGHAGQVRAIAFSPDGKTLASGSVDSTIKLWDVTSGTELRTLKGHSGWVYAVAFSPDGKTLASGSVDSTIKLWDITSGTELRTLTDHSEQVTSVEFSPDGKTLASGSWDNTITLWDVTSGTELSTLTGHSDVVDSVAFSPDGKTLASGSWDMTIKLWDLASKTEARTLTGHSDVVDSVAFNPDGKTLASGSSDNTIKLWDVTSGTELRTLKGHSDVVNSVAFGSDCKTLASGSSDNTIKLWDVTSGTELRTLKGHSSWVDSVAFSTDGKKLASGSWDHSIKLWEVASGTELHSLADHSAAVNSVAFSPEGMTLGSSGNTIKLWNVAVGIELRSLGGDSSSVAFTSDGKTLASRGGNTIKLWDLANGTELRTFTGHSPEIDSLAFSPDGKTLASGSPDSTITLWDVTSGTELRTLKGHSGTVCALAFSPDGKTLGSGSWDKTVKLWEIASGAELRTLTGHSGPVISVAFSPNGKIVASGSYDKTIKLWNVVSGTEARALKGHSLDVRSVAFSPDGKTLASGSSDNTIKLWDGSTGTELRTLKGHYDWVNSVAFSSDGKTLASGSGDTYIKLWRVADGTELASLLAFDEKDWAVVTPDGLFDSSPAAWNEILWRFKKNTFDHAPVEAFFSEFYYPGLLADIFAGKHPKSPSDISQKDRRQPRLKLTLADAPANATLKARNVAVKIDVAELAANKDNKTGSGAQDVRLFQNGSLVKLWRGDVLRGQSSVALEATIPIGAGENKLTAYAFNHDNIKSSDAALTVTGADSLKRKGMLHILAVGVSQYANPEYNLDYTTDDATSFASQLKLEQEKQTRYQSVEIKTLLNENATKANFLAELKQLAASVQPEDGVVVFFSGHGKASGDHFYLVPHDLGYSGSRDQLSATDLQRVLKHSISDVELEEAFRGIDAGQMFMIIDACNSGQALENKDEPRRGPMNTRGLAQLAYEKGIYIMTASQNVEEAFVSKKLKHSYLTYALVEEGLKTKAADADQNGEVTLREWFDYALARVPKLREETLQSKSLEEVTPNMKAARSQKSQTPRVFYRREAEFNPLVVAVLRASAAPQ